MKIDKNILQKYIDGTCSGQEKALLEEWFENFDLNDQNFIDEYLLLYHVKNLDNRIKESDTKSKKMDFWRYFAAASVLILSFFSIIWLINSDENKNIITKIEDIKAPKYSNAVVILEDQQEYNIDSLRIGDTIRTKNYLLTKQANGELNYIQLNKIDIPIYNTLKTASGGISHVKLVDGSMVWLNANSELTYPISFDLSEREVFLKGEGYFEIVAGYSNGKRRNFYIRGENHTIQVLGTKFNANLRPINQIALVEGKVRIANSGSILSSVQNIDFNHELLPNQVYTNGVVKDANNINIYTDWKEGYFDLTDLSLSQLAIELSDWYGVGFEVSTDLDKHMLFGRISRHKSLKEVLDIINEATPMKYTLNNNIISITN